MSLLKDWNEKRKLKKYMEKTPEQEYEIYQWTIIDGKDSYYDCINVVFTNSITGKSTPSVSLYENDVANIGIPHVLIFECRMWLI